MLKCVYHPTHSFQVVEDDEADKMISTGFWFDNPTDAKIYRKKIEDKIKQKSSKTIKSAQKLIKE